MILPLLVAVGGMALILGVTFGALWRYGLLARDPFAQAREANAFTAELDSAVREARRRSPLTLGAVDRAARRAGLGGDIARELEAESIALVDAQRLEDGEIERMVQEWAS